MRSRRRDDFSVARIFFSEAGLVKWTRQKTTQTLENKLKRLGEENQQKRARQSNGEYSSGSRRYRPHQKSLGQPPCYHCRVLHFFYRAFFISWLAFYCPPDTIAVASSATQTSAFWLVDELSCFLRCFLFFELVNVSSVVHVYLQLNRLTPNTKIAW